MRAAAVYRLTGAGIGMLVGLSWLGLAAAQVPLGSAITYQGQLRHGGVAATGLFDFQLCLFSAPADPIPLACDDFDEWPVEDGLFTLAPDFGPAVFVGDERHLEIRVRANGVGGGYTILSPRQLVRAAPEALSAAHAASAPWSGLTGVPALGTVNSVAGGSGLSGGTITTSGTLSVDTATIQARVTGSCPVGQYVRQINQAGTVVCGTDGNSGGTVTSVATGAGLSGGPITTTGAIAVAPGGIVGGMIADGAVGSSAVDATQVQLRVVGECPGNEYVSAIHVDGSVECNLLPVSFNRLAEFGSTRDFYSLAMRSDGRPVMAFQEADFPWVASILVCANPVCSAGAKRVIDPTQNTGYGTAVVVRSDHRPIVLYNQSSPSALRLHVCSDSNCDDGVIHVIEADAFTAGPAPMVVRSDDRAMVVYRSTALNALRRYSCDDADCSSGSVVTLDANDGSGGAISIALRANGVPVIAYNRASVGLRLFNCGTAECTSGSSTLLIGNTVTVISTHVVVRPDGRPLVVYRDFTNNDVRLFDCNNVSCSSGAVRIIPNSGNPEKPTLRIRANGLPQVVFAQFGAPDNPLWLVDCIDGACSASVRRTVFADVSLSRFAATVRPDDRPVFARPVSGGSQIHICANSSCE